MRFPGLSRALSTALCLVFLGPPLALWMVWFPLGFWLDLLSWFGFPVPKSSKPRFHRLRELLLDQGWIATLNELPSLRFGWGDLISKLEVLERWHSQEEEGRGAQASARGYKRGDPKGRAVAARLPVTKTEFPAILQIARLWELEEDAGPAFVGDTRIEVESGPGPVQPFVRIKWFSCAGIKVKPCRESTLHTHLVFGVGLNLPWFKAWDALNHLHWSPGLLPSICNLSQQMPLKYSWP